ncbi:MAG TPA: alpha/beta fold hydrolase [Steroidobacteraceae bacterium]|nr:alpha/beta fold hydrolase [Steroidobacteraceae bacterium]
MVKASKFAVPPTAIRTRRAYFDCKFGQLHVRTAFPATGGFDEQVTLFCLHPLDASSRLFGRFLPELADVRSVYAPDLPGCGESDPSATRSIADDATAISDMADDLRLRQIDLLGVHYGAEVAMAIAAARPQLVRRLVLLGAAAGERMRGAPHRHLVIDIAEYGDDPFGSAPQRLAKQIHPFLATAPSTA